MTKEFSCDISMLTRFHRESRPDRLKRLMEEYLEKGADPYFVYAVFRSRVYSEEIEERDSLMKIGEFLKDQVSDIPPILDKSEMFAPISRIWTDDGKPRLGLAPGIYYSAVIEAFDYFYCQFWTEEGFLVVSIEDFILECGKFVHAVLAHPECTLDLANFFDLSLRGLFFQGRLEMFGVRLSIERAAEIFSFLFNIEDVRVDFFDRLIKQFGLETIIQELLESCLDIKSYELDVWSRIGVIARVPEDIIATRVLESLINLAHEEDKSIRDAVHSVLSLGFRFGFSKRKKDYAAGLRFVSISTSVNAFSIFLKNELLCIRTIHAINRWFTLATPEARAHLIAHLGFVYGNEAPGVIDHRTETIIESLFGDAVWESICNLQNPVLWVVEEQISLDVRHPEVQQFRTLVRQRNLSGHNCDLAEQVDLLVHESGISLVEFELLQEEMLNLILGDSLFTVTHLRDSWMRLRRREDEIMNSQFSRVDIARRRDLGDVGSACRFQVHISDLPNTPLHGQLDEQGEISFGNVLYLTPLARTAVCTVVIQSLCAVLIPSYVDALPPRGGVGGIGIRFSGEISAARPVIHTLGELQLNQRSRNQEERGSRINPAVAEILFRWLLDDLPDCPFRLFVPEVELMSGREEIFYVTRLDAKERLCARNMALDQVFARLIRAYSRPLGVYLNNEGDIIVQTMSTRARRNYERYLLDGGRELDFSSVRKTYILPSGRRIVMDVPRTFNRGTFRSLEDFYNVLLVPELREQATSRFVINTDE